MKKIFLLGLLLTLAMLQANADERSCDLAIPKLSDKAKEALRKKGYNLVQDQDPGKLGLALTLNFSCSRLNQVVATQKCQAVANVSRFIDSQWTAIAVGSSMEEYPLEYLGSDGPKSRTLLLAIEDLPPPDSKCK